MADPLSLIQSILADNATMAASIANRKVQVAALATQLAPGRSYIATLADGTSWSAKFDPDGKLHLNQVQVLVAPAVDPAPAPEVPVVPDPAPAVDPAPDQALAVDPIPDPAPVVDPAPIPAPDPAPAV